MDGFSLGIKVDLSLSACGHLLIDQYLASPSGSFIHSMTFIA